MSFYVLCHQYALPTFRIGLLASNNLMKIAPHRSAWRLGLWLFPDAVQLLAKTSHHGKWKRGGKRAQERVLSLRLGQKAGLRDRGRRCLEKVVS